MVMYLSMDDTDNKESRGTGRLARSVAAEIATEYPILGITRHQLYVHEDIPFTSHNSCAVLHVHASGSDAKEWIFGFARELMLDDFVEGSDPGIAVAETSQITPPLVAFGRDAKTTVLTQAKARELAKNLGIRLEGLGGTEDGVIGTMAGLGLASTHNDGRYIQKGAVRDFIGPSDASVLLEAGIDRIYTLDGREVTDGTVHVADGKSVKPCPVNGMTVLFVDEIDGMYQAVKRN